MRVEAVVSILLALVLSGCLGGDPAPTGEDNGSAIATEETGALSGFVVKEEGLVFLPDVRIRLIENGEVRDQTHSGSDGSYAISNIIPGTYRLEAFSVQYRPSVQTVTIAAGEVQTKNIQLVPFDNVTSRIPFVAGPETYNGFFSCTVSLYPHAPGSFSPCASSDDSHGTGTATAPGKGVRTLTVGLEWTPGAVAGAQELTLEIKNSASGDVYALHTATDDFQIRIDDGDIAAEHAKFSDYDAEDAGDLAIQFEVFAPTGVTYQQPFTIHYALHHWQDAPAGFSVLPDA